MELNIPVMLPRLITEGAKPNIGQLKQGQLAVNLRDLKLYTLTDQGLIRQIGVSPSDLASVAFSGSYADLSNKPAALAPASATVLGGIKVGAGLTIAADGTLSGLADAPNDGQQYGRQSNGWAPIVQSSYLTGSTVEQWTGGYWHTNPNRKAYMKWVTGSSPNNTNMATYAHGVANMVEGYVAAGYIWTTSNTSIPIPFTAATTSNSVVVSMDTASIFLTTSGVTRPGTWHIQLIYCCSDR